jgi:hypothetical protein
VNKNVTVPEGKPASEATPRSLSGIGRRAGGHEASAAQPRTRSRRSGALLSHPPVREDDLRLHLGPSRSGSLLEVIVVIRASGRSELAIHAMPMRDKYRRLLPGV